MNLCALSSENKYEIWAYVILIAFSISAALSTVLNIKISPDGMRFGLISQQILSGNGIRVPIIRLEDTYTLVNGTIPFLDQMPLLPIIFAVLGGLTPQNYLPAQAVNVISHVIISFFTFLIMMKLSGKWTALLTGLLVSFSHPLLWLTNHICSDPLFLAMIMASTYYVILSRSAEGNRQERNLLIAGCFAGAAIFTRNAGIALIPVIGWGAFLLLINRRPGSKYVSIILSVAIPIAITGGMFIRNFIVSGSLRGFSSGSPGRTYSQAVIGTINMLFQQFNLGMNAVILIFIFMVVLTIYIILSPGIRKVISNLMGKGVDLLFIFILSYMSMIVIVMAKQQWNFELRYVSPLVPFTYIGSILLIVLVCTNIKDKGHPILSLTGIILSLSIVASGSVYKTVVNFSEFFYKQEKAYAILDSCAYKWIIENYAINNVIVTNRPFHLSFFGGYSTVALPHKRFEPGIHVPEDMQSVLPDRMLNFGSNVLALFEKEEEQYEGHYLAGLFNKRENNESFNLAYDCPDGVVYILKK